MVNYQESLKHGFRVGRYDVPPHHFQSDLVDRPDPREVELHDARSRDPPFRLETDGFELRAAPTACSDLQSDEQVVKLYYGEVRELIAQVTGASHVLAFDHIFREQPATEGHAGPVHRVHTDYTPDSADRRLAQVFEGGLYSLTAGKRLDPARLQKLASCRHAFFTAWRGVGPIASFPLALVHPSSVQADERMYFELVAVDEDRDRENFTLAFQDSHKWYFYADMQPGEVLLRKDFDSDQSALQGVFHAAAAASQASQSSRRSLEVRLIAFFADSGSEAAKPEMLSPKISMRNRRLIGMFPPHE